MYSGAVNVLCLDYNENGGGMFQRNAGKHLQTLPSVITKKTTISILKEAKKSDTALFVFYF
jgi:hypothetical protein